MAKRIPLSQRREKDQVKGVDAFFQENTDDSNSDIEVSTNTKVDSDTRKGKIEKEGKIEVTKVTVYIRPDQVLMLERIQLRIREITGKKPDKGDLTQEAFDLLAQKYRHLF